MRREILTAFLVLLLGLALAACTMANPIPEAQAAGLTAGTGAVIATPAPPEVVSRIVGVQEGVSTPDVLPSPAPAAVAAPTSGGEPVDTISTLDVEPEGANEGEGGVAAIRSPDLPKAGETPPAPGAWNGHHTSLVIGSGVMVAWFFIGRKFG